jgi:tetratricopeptide (TPR) repeat protein
MFRLASVIAILLFLSSHALAQKPATIAGNVYFESDYNPAKNVTVNLYDDEHNLLEAQTTTDTGQFRFGNVRRATYQLTVEVPGYENASVDVDVSMISDKGITIYLKPVAKDPAPSTSSRPVSVHELSMPAKARDLVDSGKTKLYRDKNAQAALLDFQQAVSLAPAYYEAFYQLAMAQYNLGNRGEAESSFRRALDLSQNKYPEASVGLGTALIDDGNLPGAEKLIRQGLVQNQNLWIGHYELGRVLLLEKQYPDALNSAEQARLLAPSVPVVYRLLSNIHLAQKDYPALLADLDTYISLDPDSPAGQRAKQLRSQLQLQHPTPATTQPPATPSTQTP